MTFLLYIDNLIYMRRIKLQSIVWKEDKYYVAQCLNVDVSSFGKTKNEALANLNEALELFFEDAKSPRLTNVERPVIVSTTFQYA